MPDNSADLSFIFGLKPEDAIRHFEDKGFNISWDWEDTWQDAHAKAFTVAKVTQMDILQDIRNALQNALDEGQTFEEFQKNIKPILKSKGWWGKIEDTNPNTGKVETIQAGSPWRLRTIFDTNIQTSFMAGHYKQQLENVDNRPYWMYVAILDQSTRPAHRILNGKVFRYDDPFWENFYPPNGWRCRCRVRTLDQDYIDENKLDVESAKDKINWVNKLVSRKTGELQPVAIFHTTDALGNPESIAPDVGWSYNVGQAAWNIDVLAYNRIKDMPDNIKAQFISDMANSIPRQKAFASLVNRVDTEKMKRGFEQPVGWMNIDTLNYLKDKSLMPVTPVISMTDQGILHSIRTPKKERGATASIEEIQKIPDFISKSSAILFDKQDTALIYVVNTDDDNKRLKIVTKINNLNKKMPVNAVVTVGKVNIGDLKNKRYEIIKGKI